MSTQIISLGTGKCSFFGGPDDEGVGQLEGLALVSIQDLTDWWFARCFLAPRPHVGAARTLNPKAFYCAMRWGYGDGDGNGLGEILPNVPASIIRRCLFRVWFGQINVFVQAVDWGPNRNTGRLIDLSPGAVAALGCDTDDLVTVEAIIPGGLS